VIWILVKFIDILRNFIKIFGGKMRKFLIGFLMYIIFILLYFLQANFFSWFTIAGVSPNIFIIYILFIGLFTDNKFSLIMSLLTGLTLDLVAGRTLGITALIFSLVSIVAGYFEKNFSKENKITIIIMVIGTTMACEILNYFLNVLILEIPAEILAFSKILIIETIYNIFIINIFYKLILKSGVILERQFKQKNILTRYF